MAKFPEDLYLVGPHEPAGVFHWGKSPELNKADLATGTARLGGFRTPNYCRAYLLAANTLLGAAREEMTLDHNALPIFFLQRHAAELMIKAPLQIGIEIQQYREKLNLSRSDFPSEGQMNRAENGHGLRELLADLDVMVKVLQVAVIPEVFRSVIGEILQVEQKGHTWSRYSFHHEGKKEAKTRRAHLQEEIIIPLGRIQNQLQDSSDALGSIWPFDASLMGMLGSQQEHMWRLAGDID